MLTINLRDAKAGRSSLVDEAAKGEIVTITRHGKPVATLVSVEAAEFARKALDRKRPGLVSCHRTFPGGEFPRNRKPSRGCRALSGFLLDTSVVSVPAPSKSAASADLFTWLDRMDADGRPFSVRRLHSCDREGNRAPRPQGATAKAASLKAWLSGPVSTYDDKIIGRGRAKPVASHAIRNW